MALVFLTMTTKVISDFHSAPWILKEMSEGLGKGSRSEIKENIVFYTTQSTTWKIAPCYRNQPTEDIMLLALHVVKVGPACVGLRS